MKIEGNTLVETSDFISTTEMNGSRNLTYRLYNKSNKDCDPSLLVSASLSVTEIRAMAAIMKEVDDD